METHRHPMERERLALARRHAEVVQSVRQMRQLGVRVDSDGANPHVRRVAAALVAELDDLLPDVLARETRLMPAPADLPPDPWVRQAAEQLQADQGWISANWYELQPLVDALAHDESWVDPDRLRDATDLFCTLVWEHVSLVTTLFERSDMAVLDAPGAGRAPAALTRAH